MGQIKIVWNGDLTCDTERTRWLHQSARLSSSEAAVSVNMAVKGAALYSALLANRNMYFSKLQSLGIHKTKLVLCAEKAGTLVDPKVSSP